MKKKLIIILVLLISITLLLIRNYSTSYMSKEDTIKNFYSSYVNKDINIFNDSVVDTLKIKTEEATKLQNLLYEDLLSFELLEIKENTQNPVTTINGVTYAQENIAEFTIYYKIDFDKNIYGTAGEGNQSVRKVLIRKDKDSPWLIAGQLDGQGY